MAAKKSAAKKATPATPAIPAKKAGGATDGKASRRASEAEREARKAGKEIPTSAHTVSHGRSVIQGKVTFKEGDTVQLTPADSARMVATGAVTKDSGKAAAAPTPESTGGGNDDEKQDDGSND